MLKIISLVRFISKVLLAPINSFESIKSILAINKFFKDKKACAIFYDRFAMHYSFTKPVIDELHHTGLPFIHIVGEKLHPSTNGENVFFVDKTLEVLFRFLHIELLITPASNFSSTSKHRKTKLAYLFHSPVSMHNVYTDNAFDAYDVFFAVGPHHSKEIQLLSESRRWKNKVIYESGYPKIDILRKTYEQLTKNENQDKSSHIPQIMFAPSWGNTNILRLHGLQIVSELIQQGYNIVLRPHKHSFDYDQDILNEIISRFSNQNFEMDLGSGFEKMLASDVLISDWSGVAYEYAFATERPVISINVPNAQKIQAQNNIHINTEAMEDVCRFSIGIVCKPEEVSKNIKKVLSDDNTVNIKKIRRARDEYLFNYGKSARIISEQIIELCKEHEDS